jgi:hypothetical protein
LHVDAYKMVKEDIIREYGPYVAPSLERARMHYFNKCSHHFMFSFWRTKLSDLTEFGTGHLLYLGFLRYLALTFSALCVILGVPLIVTFMKRGSFFANGMMRKATLGHYGPLYVEGAMRAGGVVRSPVQVHLSVISRCLNFLVRWVVSDGWWSPVLCTPSSTGPCSSTRLCSTTWDTQIRWWKRISQHFIGISMHR